MQYKIEIDVFNCDWTKKLESNKNVTTTTTTIFKKRKKDEKKEELKKSGFITEKIQPNQNFSKNIYIFNATLYFKTPYLAFMRIK